MAETNEKKSVAERASDLSDEVLEQIEARQRAAIGAMRNIIDRLDDATPDLVDPALRKKVVDAIGEYYEQLATKTNKLVRKAVRTEIGMVTNPGNPRDLYGFLRGFVRRPGEAVSKQDDDAQPAD